MAGKMSTLILTVDLECRICSKKIRKILCKLQDREVIESISYDEKNNKVVINGPFDPHKLKKKLCCKAGKVIKEIKIKEQEKNPPPKDKEKEKEKPKEKEKEKPKEKEKEEEKEKEKPKETEKEKDKEKSKEKEKEKPKEKEKEKEKEKSKEKEKPKEKEEQKEKEKPKEKEKEKEKPKEKEKEEKISETVLWPAGPIWPVGPSCCWRPWYEEYRGGFRCCSCGMFFRWPEQLPPTAGVCTGRPYACQFFCEEDPSSCSIM